MGESVALVDMLFFLVDDLGVSREDNALYKVRCVVDLRQLILILNVVSTLLDLVFCLLLNHLSAVTH